MNHNKATISQCYYWHNLSIKYISELRFAKIIRKQKRKQKCDRLPTKEAEAIPWGILLVDLIGQSKIIREVQNDPRVIKYFTVI